jgi:predicted P-loop ATPase
VTDDDQLPIATAPKRDSLHWEQTTTTWAEICGWVASPGSKKEAGNYLLGTLCETTVDCRKNGKLHTGLHRRKAAVVSRSAITLDVDTPRPDFADTLKMTFPYAAVAHTTFSSSPDQQKWRVIVRPDRPLAPDEYIAASTHLVEMLGAGQFDPSTTQPERYMFRPAAQRPEWFVSFVIDGPPAPVDQLLAGWEKDLSAAPMPRPHKNKRDPFELEGVIGAFNRAYEDWDLLIETYELPYERVGDDRYQLVGSVSQAGMGPIPGTHGLVFSHHSNDPAYGQTCSAFDLVRLHRFSEQDERADPKTPVNKLPSQAAMLDLAAGDHRVTAELVGLDFDEIMDETVATPDEWKLKLRRAPKTGKVVDDIRNWDLIRANDTVFQILRFNELTLSVEWECTPPWRKQLTDPTVSNNDRWEFVHHIERSYGIKASRGWVDSVVDTKASQRTFNPVRDYLEALEWDGVKRVETCLPGVKPTAYTRLVARKVMVAAVARMFKPGCKWDHTLVLVGVEGLGKSHWIERIARGFSSSLGRIDNKDTLLVMQRSWIVVADESHSLRKADHDAQKEFLTRTSDVFRMPYDRETLAHPRHCVIWSTTNDETFLRRQEGNRRFLTVHCSTAVDFDALTDAYVDQLWAEAVFLYRGGESLYLAGDESRVASAERERFIEEDALAGVVLEYLNTPVPADWWELAPTARQQWLADRAAGFVPEGTEVLDRVCSTQVWVEALGRRIGDHRRVDLLDISNVLRKLPGWYPAPGRIRLPGYGPQQAYIRHDLL